MLSHDTLVDGVAVAIGDDAPPPSPNLFIAHWEKLIAQPVFYKGIRKEVTPTNSSLDTTPERPVPRLKKVQPVSVRDAMEMPQAREQLNRKMFDYANDPTMAGSALLLRVPPGVGKTYSAIAVAEHRASKGERVIIWGPSNDHFATIADMASRPEEWVAVRGRNKDNCAHHETLNGVASKGYDTHPACMALCGKEVMDNKCAYHRQKRISSNLIYMPHQYLVFGHPLVRKDALGIIDENFLKIFCRKQEIDGDKIVVPGALPDAPILPIVHALQKLAAQTYIATNAGQRISGLSLHSFLADRVGGMEALHERLLECRGIEEHLDRLVPEASTKQDFDALPTNYYAALVRLLRQEVEYVLTGKTELLERVAVDRGKLILVDSRRLRDDLPDRLIITDATMDTEIMRHILRGRHIIEDEVRVRPVGKTKCLAGRNYGVRDVQANASDMPQLILRHIQEIIELEGVDPMDVAVIAAKKVLPLLNAAGLKVGKTGYFYNVAGSNAFKSYKVVIVVGTPHPDKAGVEDLVKSLYPERMELSDTTYSYEYVPFPHVDTTGDEPFSLATLVGGYRQEPIMQRVLELSREGELLQCAHRARLNNNPDAIAWLITNVPVEELPLDCIYSKRVLYGGPEGIPVPTWERFVPWAKAWVETNPYITMKDIMEGMSVRSEKTARKLLGGLISHLGWEALEAAVPPSRKAGRRPTRVAPNQSTSETLEGATR